MKKVVIGSDHAGFAVKERIIKELGNDYEFLDMGPKNENDVDYPVLAEKVAQQVALNTDVQGVVICGNGVGISIAANKVKGVRCGLAYSVDAAKCARLHNDANVVSVAGRSPMMDDPVEIVKVFLETDFSGIDRHARRVKQVMEIEKRNS